jgi:hypothetical protein
VIRIREAGVIRPRCADDDSIGRTPGPGDGTLPTGVGDQIGSQIEVPVFVSDWVGKAKVQRSLDTYDTLLAFSKG